MEGENWDDAETKANLGLPKGHEWYSKNSISLNHDKSVFISFSLLKAISPNLILFCTLIYAVKIKNRSTVRKIVKN